MKIVQYLFLLSIFFVSPLFAMQYRLVFSRNIFFPLNRKGFSSKKIHLHGEWRDQLRKKYSKKELKWLDNACEKLAQETKQQFKRRILKKKILDDLAPFPFKEVWSAGLEKKIDELLSKSVKKKT